MPQRDDARDPVATYLTNRGASDQLRHAGLRGLITRWSVIARDAAHYNLTIDDWLNDVDLRDMIAGAMAVAPDAERHAVAQALDDADESFRSATMATKRSLWGDPVSVADNHDPQQQWWYFRRPAHPGKTMRADLTAAGVD
jgi:hypothetical protein